MAAGPVYYAVQSQGLEAMPSQDAVIVTPAVPAVQTIDYVREDGIKIQVEGDAVYLVAEEGTRTALPDGEHKTTDGSVLTVKDGKLVP